MATTTGVPVPAFKLPARQFHLVDHQDELNLLDALYLAHPDHLVTRIDQACNIFDFAREGYATATLDENYEGLVRTRSIVGPADRKDYGNSGPSEFADFASNGNGKSGLVNTFVYAKYDYKWKEHDFIIYSKPGAYSPFEDHRSQCNYVLYRRQPGEAVRAHSKIIDELLLAVLAWMDSAEKKIVVYHDHLEKRPDMWNGVQEASWDDIVMDPAGKTAIQEDIEGFFMREDVYKNLHVPWQRGIIFHGPAGNGKLMAVKAIMKSLSQRSESIQSLYVNKTIHWSHYVDEIFSEARRLAPCLVVLENIDQVQSSAYRNLLAQIDKSEENKGIMFIATVRDLHKTDPSISSRPFRFDRKYHFANPEYSERVQYCRSWSKKLEGNKDLAFPQSLSVSIAGYTEGLSFSQLREALQASLMRIAAHTIVGDDCSDDSFDFAEDSKSPFDLEEHPAEYVEKLPLAIEMRKQVDTLRESLSASSKTSHGSISRGKFLRDDDKCSWRGDSFNEVVPHPDLKPKKRVVFSCFEKWRKARTT